MRRELLSRRRQDLPFQVLVLDGDVAQHDFRHDNRAQDWMRPCEYALK